MLGLWITPMHQAPSCTTLKVEGQLAGDWVGRLEEVCQSYLEAGRTVTLDLGNLTFVNHPGLDLLRRLLDQGVELRNCTPLLRDRLGPCLS